MNRSAHHYFWLGLLAMVGCAASLSAPQAQGQSVIRGTAPGWPGNTAYYAPQNVYRSVPAVGAPVVQAQYTPQAGVTAYYAPASAARIAYAVPAVGSYQISYAGANQPGTAMTAYYGGYSAPVQRVAYLPQQVYYAPQPGAVAYYRPVTVYQPAAVVPQTCNYASACQTATCGSSCGSSCGSGWRPFAWLFGSGSTCCKPSCAPQGCGAAVVPYYTTPTVPVIPTVPAPGVPASPFRSTIITPGTVSPTIPAPPTRTPSGTIIPSAPADTTPRLTPGAFGAPGVTNPGVAPAIPFSPGSGGAFTPPPEYRPVIEDPYSQPAPAQNNVQPNNAPLMLAPPAASGSQVIGSGYRTNSQPNSDRTNLVAPQQRAATISEPSFGSPPASVRPLRDPHEQERTSPNDNRAPQLLSPGDRTAAADPRWSVIPAVWPVKQADVQPVVRSEPLTPVVAPTQLDDGGWKSAR